jgi:hypothetical protein
VTIEPTPEVKRLVEGFLAGPQDTDAFIQLHGMLQANILAPTLRLGNGNLRPPEPDALRLDAVDLRFVADAMAQFLEHLADRIEARSN